MYLHWLTRQQHGHAAQEGQGHPGGSTHLPAREASAEKSESGT